MRLASAEVRLTAGWKVRRMLVTAAWGAWPRDVCPAALTASDCQGGQPSRLKKRCSSVRLACAHNRLSRQCHPAPDSWAAGAHLVCICSVQGDRLGGSLSAAWLRCPGRLPDQDGCVVLAQLAAVVLPRQLLELREERLQLLC